MFPHIAPREFLSPPERGNGPPPKKPLPLLRQSTFLPARLTSGILQSNNSPRRTLYANLPLRRWEIILAVGSTEVVINVVKANVGAMSFLLHSLNRTQFWALMTIQYRPPILPVQIV